MHLKKDILITQIHTKEYITKFRDETKFIEFCKQCKNYNSVWSCPPFDTNYTKCISKFSITTLIGVKINIDKTTAISPSSTQERDELIKNILGSTREEIDKKLLKLETEISPSLIFYAGSCRICTPNVCSRANGQKCRFPHKMRSTLEAIGFDMARTTSELLGVELKWCNNNELPPYFTLVYGLLSNKPTINQIKAILN